MNRPLLHLQDPRKIEIFGVRRGVRAACSAWSNGDNVVGDKVLVTCPGCLKWIRGGPQRERERIANEQTAEAYRVAAVKKASIEARTRRRNEAFARSAAREAAHSRAVKGQK